MVVYPVSCSGAVVTGALGATAEQRITRGSFYSLCLYVLSGGTRQQSTFCPDNLNG